jgi:hypothetical protein
MKDQKELENKAVQPAANKAAEKKMVRIKLRPGRAVTGVTVDAEGCAEVDEATAERLYKIGYAIKE